MAKRSIREVRAARIRSATILDVARVAGVSKSTVSLVLQDSPLVKDETRDLIKSAIKSTGYIYNRSAAGLRKAKSDLIGIVICDLTNPFFPELSAGIEDVLSKSGFLPVLANASESVERQAEVIKILREHGVAGLILCPARGTTAWSLAEAVPRGLPVVITMRAIDDCPFPYVGPNNTQGVMQATKHLIEHGHRSIAFVGGNPSFAAQRERVAGWKMALAEAGLPIDERLVFESAPTRAHGSEVVSALLASPARPTAALCYNDVVALGVSQALSERGIILGKAFSLIGFDDIAESAHSLPPLTTLNAGTRSMGREAAIRLINRLNDPATPVSDYHGEAKLVLRGSVASIPLTSGANQR